MKVNAQQAGAKLIAEAVNSPAQKSKGK